MVSRLSAICIHCVLEIRILGGVELSDDRRLTISNGLNAVGLSCKEIGAILIDGGVEEPKVVKRNARLYANQVAVLSELDLVELAAVGVCSGCNVCWGWSLCGGF